MKDKVIQRLVIGKNSQLGGIGDRQVGIGGPSLLRGDSLRSEVAVIGKAKFIIGVKAERKRGQAAIVELVIAGVLIEPVNRDQPELVRIDDIGTAGRTGRRRFGYGIEVILTIGIGDGPVVVVE